VEAWLVADFFTTQISHPSFDDFYGHPGDGGSATPEIFWERPARKAGH